MIITIDKAGRVRVPLRFRKALNLMPGSQLEVHPDGASLKLTPIRRGEALVEKKGFLIHHGGSQSNLNIAEFITAERE